MPTPDEPFRVAVFCEDDEQLKQAEESLRAVRPDKTTVYSGVVEGWLTPDRYTELVREGFLIDVTDPTSPEEAEPNTPLFAARAETPEPDQLEEFREQARDCALEEGGGLIAGAAGARDDARMSPIAVDEPAPLDVYWVRFKRPLSPPQRQELEERGLEISGYEPPNTYKLFLTKEQHDELKTLPFVEAIDPYTFEQTVTPHLVEAAVAEPSQPLLLQDAGPQLDTFDCILHRSRDEERVRTILERTEGVQDVSSSEIFVRFKAPPDAPLLSAIAHLPEVRKLAPYRPPELLMDHARKLVGVETINPPPERWTGSGQVVGIFDSGIDATHDDLADRVESAESTIASSATDAVGHGTHVAGIIAGTGAASGGAVRGVAPGAKLVVVQITDGGPLDLPPNLGDLLVRATDKGAKIVNLSWGSPVSGDYDVASLGIDRFICDHPDVLVVVAAGNDGAAPEGYVGMKSVFAPASAKNVVTVGASASDRPHDPELRWGTFRQAKFPDPPSSEDVVCGNPDLPAALSSRGPTDFDSVKPDVLAPGTFILSARAAGTPDSNFWEPLAAHGGKYAFNGGTSMATPVVTGAAAVVRQYLTEERQDLPSPSAALVKAILIASTIKLPSARPAEQQEKVGYPDFDQGFGRIDLSTVLPGPHAPKRRLELVDVANDSPDALESRAPLDSTRKASRRYSVDIGPDAREVRVVLAWTDRPSRSVQNNLGLDVSGPGGLRTLGNAEHTFLKDPLFDDPQSTGMIFDKRNNVEQVLLANPVPGRYRIRVWAENTALPPQGYALCAVGDLAGPMTVGA